MGLAEKLKLSSKQQRALEALLREPTIQAAADAAGVSKATIFRWLAEDVFSAVYRDLRGQLLESTLTALQQASGDAVATLRTVMTDETAKGSERVSAARCVLEMSLKAREILETEERLADLETRLNAQPGLKRAR
jgi:AcrR family transcriptional regulator